VKNIKEICFTLRRQNNGFVVGAHYLDSFDQAFDQAFCLFVMGF